MTRQTLTEWLEDYLEKKGAVAEVGPDHYQAFLELTDKEMYRLIRLIIYVHATEINRMVFDQKGRYKDADIFKLIQNTLSLMFHGTMWFGPGEKFVLTKRQGPAPTPEQSQMFEERVRKAVPMIRRAIVQIMNRQVPLGRKR